jgi:methionyl aminopeptidase
MRLGGQILAQILQDVKAYTRAGLNELEINDWVRGKIAEYGAEASYLEETPPYPGVICISVNDELVHSPPSDYELQKGDVVSYDLTIKYQGMHTDATVTTVVDEKPSGSLRHLITNTERSLYAGIEQVRPGARTGDIGAAVSKVLEVAKLGVVRDYIGHGIGTAMHMLPNVPNFGMPGTGDILREGDTICIEPMATLGKEATVVSPVDGWTVSMKDGSLCAHFEHTVLVTKNGYEILTK